MAKENNRNCVVCGRGYRVCKTCEDMHNSGLKQWRMSCDKVECYLVLLTLTDFYYGRIDKYKAREMLSGVLSDDMLPYDPQAKVLIDRIYEEDQIPDTVADEPQEETHDESKVVTEEPEEIADDTPVYIAPTEEFIPNDEPEVVVNEISDCYEIDDEV